jgi:two-component system, sensor histidine kinase PdtaS
MAEKERQIEAASLRSQAEGLSRERSRLGAQGEVSLSPDEIQSTLHELQVHQIELEMQNDELRRTQEELDATRARYFDLYEMAPVGYCTIGEGGEIREANLNAVALLGLPRKDLAGQPITRFISPEDQDSYYLHRKRLFEDGERQSFDLRLVRHGGRAFWAHMNAVIAKNPEGEPVGRLTLNDVTERKRDEEKLRRALEEKEILLQEVNHRVKNNLNLISSMLHLQSSAIHSPDQAMAAFQKSRDRILAMAFVHEELYRSGDYTMVDMSAYLRNLTRQLQLAYCPKGSIRLLDEAGGTVLSVSQSIPCGIILNELITNALKYAYPKEEGEILVGLRKASETSIELSVSDDGIGLPEGEETMEWQSLGITIVRLLVQQLDGKMEISTDHGMHYRITFPKKMND